MSRSASVSSALRLWAFMTRDYSSKDHTYTAADSAIWSCVEISIAITSACLPSLRPIVTTIEGGLSKLRSRYSKSLSSSSESERSRYQNSPLNKVQTPWEDSSEKGEPTVPRNVVDMRPYARGAISNNIRNEAHHV